MSSRSSSSSSTSTASYESSHPKVRRASARSPLHDLRHGAASTALAAHVDLRTVQGQLGHASIVLTPDTYTSVLPELHHETAEATARLVLTTARRIGHRLRKRTIHPRRRPANRPLR
ncbi:tyrosine-type recombinase/integrase [Nonomuraea angiospora]|uniref:tyrosine-type recombinase/integrase n=1 Tax=Nonomuraea angiospora TaxID=46172 RepID=UPI0036788B94